nr:hypothetical protein [Tanacetum cinerariifolium]
EEVVVEVVKMVVVVAMMVKVIQSNDQEEFEGRGEDGSLEEGGDDCGLDSNEDEVFPKVNKELSWWYDVEEVVIEVVKMVVVVAMMVKVIQSNDQEDISKGEEVSLVDGFFDGAFGGVGDEDVMIGEGVEMEVGERRMGLLQAEKGDKNRVPGLGGLGEKVEEEEIGSLKTRSNIVSDQEI